MKIKNKISKIITSIGTFFVVVSAKVNAYDPQSMYGVRKPIEPTMQELLGKTCKFAIIPIVFLIGLAIYLCKTCKKEYRMFIIILFGGISIILFRIIFYWVKFYI